MSQVWVVTGSGHGLGRSIVEEALAAGNKVIATARDTKLLAPVVDQHGDAVRILALDVTNEQQCKTIVQTAVDVYGRLDVVVNNAGYGDSRPFEEMPSDDFQRLVDTVFGGTVYMTRAALPVMREQRSGTIFQISSIGGRNSWPGQAAYHAAKWAVGGFTDAVREEAKPFGVRLATLEPGGIRTGWGERAYSDRPEMIADYLPTVGESEKALAGYWGNEPTDPRRFAQLIVRLSTAGDLPARLLIGKAAADLVLELETERAKIAERWRPFSESVDFDSPIAVDQVELRS